MSARSLALAALLLVPLPLLAQAPEQDAQALLARAEAAWAEEDKEEAERAYAAVLALDPRQPRALYRLAQLRRGDPPQAIALLRTYIDVVPLDPWGHLALSSALADAGRFGEALDAYERAGALDPDDRDIALGRPRLLARIGEPRLAAAAYDVWLGGHPDDLEAWRELAALLERQRRWVSARRALGRALALAPGDEALEARLSAAETRSAPAIDLGLLGVAETDVATIGAQAGGDLALGDDVRVGAAFQHRRLSSLGEVASSRRLTGRLLYQPRPDLRMQLSAGLVQSQLDGDETTRRSRPDVRFRLRKRTSRDRGGVDVRAQLGPVDATPALAVDNLTRQQVTAAVEVPLDDPWRLRGLGSVWLMSRRDDRNRGLRVGGALAAALAQATHVSAGWQQLRYQEPGAGYFAPERAETVEAGFDMDREFGDVSVGVDAGAGIQRVKRHGEPMGSWDRALRGWGMLGWTVAPGRQLTLEVEAYDSRITDAVVVITDRWRYVSVTANLRIALP